MAVGLRWIRWALGLDFGDIPAPFPQDTPAKRALRQAIDRSISNKINDKHPPAPRHQH